MIAFPDVHDLPLPHRLSVEPMSEVFLEASKDFARSNLYFENLSTTSLQCILM